jgi:hypothetical protein
MEQKCSVRLSVFCKPRIKDVKAGSLSLLHSIFADPTWSGRYVTTWNACAELLPRCRQYRWPAPDTHPATSECNGRAKAGPRIAVCTLEGAGPAGPTENGITSRAIARSDNECENMSLSAVLSYCYWHLCSFSSCSTHKTRNLTIVRRHDQLQLVLSKRPPAFWTFPMEFTSFVKKHILTQD